MINSFEFVNNMSPRLTLDAVCYRNYIPSELVAIIGKYFQEALDNETIRDAVEMWCSNYLRNARCLLRHGHISDWDTSKVTDMRSLFQHKRCFNDCINNWDTSKVTDMSQMFYGASSFNQPLDKWNVTNVTNMRAMFAGARSFNQPLEQWNISNVTSMMYMFYRADCFNQPLEKWNLSNVVDAHAMCNNKSSINKSL